MTAATMYAPCTAILEMMRFRRSGNYATNHTPTMYADHVRTNYAHVRQVRFRRSGNYATNYALIHALACTEAHPPRRGGGSGCPGSKITKKIPG